MQKIMFIVIFLGFSGAYGSGESSGESSNSSSPRSSLSDETEAEFVMENFQQTTRPLEDSGSDADDSDSSCDEQEKDKRETRKYEALRNSFDNMSMAEKTAFAGYALKKLDPLSRWQLGVHIEAVNPVRLERTKKRVNRESAAKLQQVLGTVVQSKHHDVPAEEKKTRRPSGYARVHPGGAELVDVSGEKIKQAIKDKNYQPTPIPTKNPKVIMWRGRTATYPS